MQQNNSVSISLLLLFLVTTLLLAGLLFVSSASTETSLAYFGTPFNYFIKHSIYLILGISLAFLIMTIPINVWYNFSYLFLLLAIILLIAVFVPGLGKSVNGASRWLDLVFLQIQASEVSRLLLIIYISAYLYRHEHNISQRLSVVMQPLLILTIIGILLILEPDFGSLILLCVTVLAMLFIAGMRVSNFVIILSLLGIIAVCAIVFSPYRIQRVQTLLDPWSSQFDGGYQIVQALIALGNGNWIGQGLGNSIQKFSYLPEAYTDFIFSVIVEEIGVIGGIAIILIYLLMIVKILFIAKVAYLREKVFASFLVYGIGIAFSCQVFFNIGVAIGILPTTGMPLPLISYGGTSLIVNCIAIALVIRADIENNQKELLV